MPQRAWARSRRRYEKREIRDRPCYPGDMQMSPWAALRAVVIFVYVFMLGPILITAAVSFNATNRSQFPPRGFSLQWWSRAFSAEWVDPLAFSFRLGAAAALISTLLALP